MEKQEFIDIINKTIKSIEAGKVDETDELLEDLFFEADSDPLVIWDEKEVYSLGKACATMYHRDIFLNEETNIVISHLAYVYFTRALELFSGDANTTYKILKDRILLLYTTADTFYDTIATILEPENNQSGVEFARTLRSVLGNYVNLMVWGDLEKVAALNPDFRNDTLLDDICNEVESELGDEDRAEKRSETLHLLLSSFIYKKMKDKDLNF